MPVSYAAFAPPSLSNDQILRSFFLIKCLQHQLCSTSDPVKAPEPATLYHIDKIPASGKPGCFLSDGKEFSGMLPWPHSHLRADSRNQHEFRVILLQPEKYFFFFRADTVQKNGLYLKSMGKEKLCKSQRSWMKKIIHSYGSITDDLVCMRKSLLTFPDLFFDIQAVDFSCFPVVQLVFLFVYTIARN